MIAGRHHDADTGTAQGSHSFRDIVPWRIAKGHKTEKGETPGNWFVQLCNRINGDGEHTQAIGRQTLGTSEPYCPCSVIQCLHLDTDPIS